MTTANATNPFNKKIETVAEPVVPQFPSAQPLGTQPVAEAYQSPNMAAPEPQPVAAPQPSPQPAAVPTPQAMPMPGGMTGGLPVAGAQPAAAPQPGAMPGGLPIPGMPQSNGAAAGAMPMPGGFSPYGQQSAAGGPALSDDFVIDLSEVSSGSVDFIGAGRHLMYCSAVSNDTSQAGNPMIVFDFTVASGEYTGKTRKVYCALTEKAMWKLDETLRALGIVSNDAKKPTYGQIRTGATRRVVIGEFVAGTYNGRATTDFQRVNPPDEMGIRTGTTLDALLSGQA